MSADPVESEVDRAPRLDRRPNDGRGHRVRLVCRWVALAALTLAAALTVRYLWIDGLPDPKTAGPPLVPILLAWFVGLTALAALVCRVETGEIDALRSLSIVYSVLAVVSLALIWFLIAQAETVSPGFGDPALNDADVAIALTESGAVSASDRGEAFFVPTGVYIQSIDFIGANDVRVTGYVWQRYADSLPAELARGFILPEAQETSDWSIESYRVRGADYEVIGWYFGVTLRQTFDYARYPFDRQDVWLRFWPKEQVLWVILTPDFSSYAPWNPAKAPGLEDQFVLEGWDLEYTVFSYHTASYDSSFGLEPYTEDWLLPELYFNVGIERSFLGILEGRLIRLLAVALLLFTLVLATESTDRRQHLLGFNVFTALPFAAALLFILILDHNELRDSLQPPGIVYIEYAHFLLYGALVLASINALLLASPGRNIRFIQHRDNVLPNLIFWPLLLTLFLLVTLVTFY